MFRKTYDQTALESFEREEMETTVDDHSVEKV